MSSITTKKAMLHELPADDSATSAPPRPSMIVPFSTRTSQKHGETNGFSSPIPTLSGPMEADAENGSKRGTAMAATLITRMLEMLFMPLEKICNVHAYE